MNERRTNIIVHPRFKEMLHIEAATNGKSMLGFTAMIAEKNENIKRLADEWRKKYNCKTKKAGHLDLP